MYSEQAQQKLAEPYYRNATLAGRGVPGPAAQKGSIPEQLDHLAKLVAECQGYTGRIEMATNRMIGSVPEDCAKKQTAPIADSMASRIEEIIRAMASMSQRLEQTAQRLDNSV